MAHFPTRPETREGRIQMLKNYIQNSEPLTPQLLAEFGSMRVDALSEELCRLNHRNGLHIVKNDEKALHQDQ